MFKAIIMIIGINDRFPHFFISPTCLLVDPKFKSKILKKKEKILFMLSSSSCRFFLLLLLPYFGYDRNIIFQRSKVKEKFFIRLPFTFYLSIHLSIDTGPTKKKNNPNRVEREREREKIKLYFERIGRSEEKKFKFLMNI